MPDVFEELAELLASVGAVLKVSPAVRRPVLYDLDYRAVVVGFVFMAASRPKRAGGERQLHSTWLKLLQFIATRPDLLNDFDDWVSERRKAHSLASQRMRRGFLSDTTFDYVIQILVASGQLRRVDDADLAPGVRFSDLESWCTRASEAGLFEVERAIVAQMAVVKPNLSMLMAGR